MICLLSLHLSRIQYSKLINGPTAAAPSVALDVEGRVRWLNTVNPLLSPHPPL